MNSSHDAEPWPLREHRGLVYLASPTLSGLPQVGHAFSTRRVDGTDAFDLGSADSTEDPFPRRRRRLTAVAGLGGDDVKLFRQVHDAGVVVLGAATVVGENGEADALLAYPDVVTHVAAVRTADCLAVLLADRGGRAVAAVHAGWRGTAHGVVRAAVMKLAEDGVPPEGLVAALGPCAGRCCYEVGTEVVDSVARASRAADSEISRRNRHGRFRLDLVAANRIQLVQEGVPAEAIDASGHCTICSSAFHSHRRDGDSAGRMMACIGFREPRPVLTGAP